MYGIICKHVRQCMESSSAIAEAYGSLLLKPVAAGPCMVCN
jgi:hypothetical protein